MSIDDGDEYETPVRMKMYLTAQSLTVRVKKCRIRESKLYILLIIKLYILSDLQFQRYTIFVPHSWCSYTFLTRLLLHNHLRTAALLIL